MELVEGDSVRELLRGGAFSLARTLSLALQITGGLEAAEFPSPSSPDAPAPQQRT